MSKKGGHPVDKFVHTHFKPIGGKTASKRWNMQCNYCPTETVKLIVHRDSCCLAHLAKTGDGFCANAPPEVREEARRRLMAKGGLEIAEPDSDNHTEPDIVEVAATSKKAKVSDKNAVVTKRGLDSFLERGMTESEKDQANVRMLRCRKFYLWGLAV